MAEKEEEVTCMGESCLGGKVKGGKGWTGKKKGSTERMVGDTMDK